MAAVLVAHAPGVAFDGAEVASKESAGGARVAGLGFGRGGGRGAEECRLGYPSLVWMGCESLFGRSNGRGD